MVPLNANITQQNNFHDILHRMQGVSGWEILEEHALLALKSVGNFAFVNFVWGNPTPEHHKKVMSFYGNKSFAWLLPTPNVYLAKICLAQVVFSEMIFPLAHDIPPQNNPHIKTIVADNPDDFNTWSIVAAENFKIPVKGIQEFFWPLVETIQCVPYLLLYDDEPAATSLVYCGATVAGVYAMGTKEHLRRKGLGTAAATACLMAAKRHGLDYAVLHSSQIGKYLYQHMGFQETGTVYEYSF